MPEVLPVRKRRLPTHPRCKFEISALAVTDGP
jgi:hypothetical protein